MKLPRGTPVLPEDKDRFFDLIEELKESFTGVIVFAGEAKEGTYEADLLIDDSYIIASSLDLKGEKDTIRILQKIYIHAHLCLHQLKGCFLPVLCLMLLLFLDLVQCTQELIRLSRIIFQKQLIFSY